MDLHVAVDGPATPAAGFTPELLQALVGVGQGASQVRGDRGEVSGVVGDEGRIVLRGQAVGEGEHRGGR